MKLAFLVSVSMLVGCVSTRPGLSATDSFILDRVIPTTHFDTLSAVARIVSPKSPKNWVKLANDAHTPEMNEEAYQVMQQNDDVRIIDQGLKMVGVDGVGKNPAHPLEREAFLFWMGVDALHDWQNNLNDTVLKNRALLALKRLSALAERGEVHHHSRWLIARLREMNGESPDPTTYPAGHAKWRFHGGSYTLYTPPSDLRWKIGHDKMGGYIGKTVSASCLLLFFFACRPSGWEDLTLAKVNWKVTVEFLNEDNSMTPMRGKFEWMSSISAR